MAKGLKHGAGGGASLNFKVVGGTAAPASPKENTIWVNTDAEIASWVFSAAEPETPAAGMVWITTDKKSTAPFNALKKNDITLCPVAASQYVNGAWVEKTAKCYKSGEWVEVKIPGFFIFKSGEGALVPVKHIYGRNASITASAEKIVYYTQSSSDLGEVTTTENLITLTGFTTLNARAKCTFYPGGNSPSLGFSNVLPGSYTAMPNVASVVFDVDSVEKVYSLPVPADLEKAYIMIGGYWSGEVYDIWLE
jgi:hypothetical protein